MDIRGNLLIGGDEAYGQNGTMHGVDAASGEKLSPAFGGATHTDLDRVCQLAEEAFDPYRALSLENRAAFLEAIADEIVALGDSLVERCMAETGLPRGRIEGERGRTVGQLMMFAGVVRDGRFLQVRIDEAMPDRRPTPRPDMRLRQVPLGPVAVFGASNFPLAFSVAGGDTASALAAGCPVIVKAHSAHPGTSALVGQAVQRAVHRSGVPAGVFALLFDTGRDISQGLVADPRIKAVGFTGSRGAGTAFMKIAAERREPIPVYAEMSSINPVVLLKGALSTRAAEIGTAFVSALTLGAGQFCTNPGLVLTIGDAGLSAFKSAAQAAIEKTPAATMLTSGICSSYREGIERLREHERVETVAIGPDGQPHQASSALFETTASEFLSHAILHDEVFGAASLIVRCANLVELKSVIAHLEGQLTIAVHHDASDQSDVENLLPLLERKAGRIVTNGFGTGVEVAHAMVHGGPYPSTSDGRSTSVGSLAINRFLRPVCYQSLADPLLPIELRAVNAWNVPRRVDPSC